MTEQEPAPDDEVWAQALDWPVGSVAERLGIAASTLRTWDRRYGIGPSRRTEGGHRRYAEDDILRVQVMARFTARGVPAQTAARVASSMDPEPLRAQASEPDHRDPDGMGMPVATAGNRPSGQAHAIAAAASGLDSSTLTALYRQALRERGLASAWTDVFTPALRLIGEMWGAGALGIHAEHLASELLSDELRAVVRDNRRRTAPSTVLLAGAEDDSHYLPLLAVQAELARQGTGATFLGARMPGPSLGEAVVRRRPRHVFLWASMPRPDVDPAWESLRVAGTEVHVVTGGPGWPRPGRPHDSRRVTFDHAPDLAAAVRLLR
jgi:DNA-binding transcriptional MerR regulator